MTRIHIDKPNTLIGLFTFIAVILVLTLAYSVSADGHLPSVDLNNGQFSVYYLGIDPPYEDGRNEGSRTVRYAVTNNGCATAGTVNFDSSVYTAGKGKGQGSGGGPKEPKCAGMSHFSIGVHLLDESHLLDPPDASGDIIDSYTATADHPECTYFSCLVGTFTPTYGNSGATKFFGLKFSKNKDEDSLPVGKTFIFQFTCQDDGRYNEGVVEVLVKPGNKYDKGELLGPVALP